MKNFISALMICLLLIGTLWGCAEKEIDRTKSAIYTDNFEITTGVLTYYFNAQYLSFLNAYGENLDNIGLDTSKPLSEQECSISSGTTWYDYFMDAAKERLTQCIVISEQAKLDNKGLNKASLKEVEQIKETIVADAKDKNLSTEDYIVSTFGEGVTLNDIVECTKFEKLATQYYNAFVKTLNTDEKTVEDYFEGHKKAYCTVDYMSFSFPVNTTDQIEINDIHQKAIDLSESQSPKIFKKTVEQYLYDYYQEKDEELSKKEIKKATDKVLAEITVNDASYSSASYASRWAFSDEREINDGLVIKNEEQNSYDVYYLISLPKRDETRLTTIRQILIDPADYKNSKAAKKEAEEILDTLKERDFNKKDFISIAAEYSADSDTATSGGLYKDLTTGMLKDAKEIEDWLFLEERAKGDSAIIKTKSYGWHIVYVENIGDPVWLTQSRLGFQNSRFEDYISELCDNFMVYENNNIIYKITEVDHSNFQV